MNENKESSNTVSAAALAFDRLYSVIKRLRADDGCPWDKVQTPLTMRNDLIEETFEAVEAVTEQDSNHAKEELGDVMLNTTMIAYMYEQLGDFQVADSINELTDKLIRRHPHVFTESEGHSFLQNEVKTADQVLSQWDAIKHGLEGREEKSVLDEVPKGFPPLLKAYKMQKKAAKKGFDWPQNNEGSVLDKLNEELGEACEAEQELFAIREIKADSEESAFLHLEEEIGDLLFSVVNWSRHLGVDPTVALSRANSKFYRRFTYVEQKMKESNIPMDSDHLTQMDDFWNKVKTSENN